MKPLAFLLVMAASSNAVCTQNNDSTMAVRGATLVDVKSGREIPDTVIVVQGERIAQIGQEGKITVLGEARTVDAKGKWFIPGLIDSHAHAEYARRLVALVRAPRTGV